MSISESNLKTPTINAPLPSDLHAGFTAFVNELKVLEDSYYSSSMSGNLTQSIAAQYRALLVRVKNYADNGKKPSEGKKQSNLSKEDMINLDDKDIAILNYVHSAILSRLNQLQSSSSSDLIIDILGFIKIIESNITELAEQQQVEKINFYRQDYQLKITEKIKEADRFIVQLNQIIGNYYKEIDNNFTSLLAEIKKLKADAKKEDEELNKARVKMESQLKWKLVFGTLKTVCSGLAFVGPQAALAGQIISGGLNIGEGFAIVNPRKKESGLPFQGIPKGVEFAIKQSKDYCDKTRDKKITNTVEAYRAILHENGVLSEPLKNLAEKKEEILKDLEVSQAKLRKAEELKSSANNDTLTLNSAEAEAAILEAGKSVKSAEDKLTAAIKADKVIVERQNERSDDEKKYEKSKKLLETTEKVVNILSAGVAVYDVYTKHEGEIDEIDKAITINRLTISKYNEFENKVEQFSEGKSVAITKLVDSLNEGIKTKSHIALDVGKWKMQVSLKNIKHELDKMTAGFQAQSDFIHVFEKVSDAIATLVDICDRIQNYQEQAQMVDYIANVSSAQVIVDYPEIRDLKLVILRNIILERYSALISAVKQWAFPFANNFLYDFNVMKGIASNQTIAIHASTVLSNVKRLKDKVEVYNATISKIDARIFKNDFGLDDSSKPPFCIWKREEYSSVIKELLKEGSRQRESEEIVLNSISSVRNSSSSSVVKFNRVELRIKHINPAEQDRLNACLSNFMVYLTRSTDSYYRFADRYYRFGGNIDLDSNASNGKLLIAYGYNKDKSGISYTHNNAYFKLLNGELMLSPYCVWRVKLTLNSSAPRSCFVELEKYSEAVDLELVGKGSYVDEDQMDDKEKEALLIGSYYTPDDMYPTVVALV